MPKAVRPGQKPAHFADKTLTLAGRDEPLLPVRVRAVDPTGQSAVFRLAAGTCLVGTSRGAHLRVTDPAVSRQHCEVELTAGGVVVTDLESTNGTFYLGRRVERIELPPGASFTVGAVTVRLESDVEREDLEPSAACELGPLQGKSVVLRQIFAIVERLRTSTIAVLIEGESGVGKEVCARAVHAHSPLKDGLFVPVRCAALPAEDLSAELFGGDNLGAIERANGATLFLDQIDALPLELQRSLLDVIESGQLSWRRPRPLPVALRIISSSREPLEAQVRAQTFSEGLFFNISAVPIRMPALRERREDIALLATHFAKELGISLPPPVQEELGARSWPGNVRELRVAVRAFGALGVLPSTTRVRGSMLDLALDEAVDLGRPYTEQKEELLERFTRRYLEALLQRTEGNQSVASRLAHLDRTYLGRMLTRHGFKT